MEEYDETKIVSRYDYNFIIEHHKNKIVENLELLLENYSNNKIIITLYQFNEDSISKYSNIFSVDYFTNQSIIIKCLLLMSKNKDNNAEKIISIIKSQINYNKIINNNNLVFSNKKLCFKLKTNNKTKEENNETINLIFYITLINLQKEKIILELKKNKTYNFYNKSLPNLIYELIEHNNNMIQYISTMEKELKVLTAQKNEIREVIKKLDGNSSNNDKKTSKLNKSLELEERRTKKKNKEINESNDDNPKAIRYNSQAKRKVNKTIDQDNYRTMNSNSYEKRNIKTKS